MDGVRDERKVEEGKINEEGWAKSSWCLERINHWASPGQTCQTNPQTQASGSHFDGVENFY